MSTSGRGPYQLAASVTESRAAVDLEPSEGAEPHRRALCAAEHGLGPHEAGAGAHRGARRTTEERREDRDRRGAEDARALELGDNRRDLEWVGHGVSLQHRLSFSPLGHVPLFAG